MWLLVVQVAPPGTEVADWWMRVGSVQGFAVLFMACVLLILIWVAIVFVNLLKKWVPKWFESSIKTHASIRAGMKEVIGIVRRNERNSLATRISLGNMMRGLEILTKKPGAKERLGVSSDVVAWIENARREIERDDEPGPEPTSEPANVNRLDHDSADIGTE